MKKFLTPMRRKLLNFIGESPTGKTFGEIQRFVVEDLHGFDYDEKQSGWKWDKLNRKYVSIPNAVRIHRGYWCTNLCGTSGMYGKPRMGILERYCIKVGNKYFLKGI